MKLKYYLNLILLILLTCNTRLEAIRAAEKDITKDLVVDHVMFPVYNNDSFLDEMKEVWEAKKVGEIKRDDYEAYSGVFFKTKSFYVEYLSTNKGDGWWRNRLCVVVDKKYWEYYNKPFSRDENFLIPEINSGFFLVSPEYNSLNSKINKHIEYDGFIIHISETLKNDLESICGLNWKLPDYIKTNKNLIKRYDIVVVDEKGEYIAPFLQCNTPWIYE